MGALVSTLQQRLYGPLSPWILTVANNSSSVRLLYSKESKVMLVVSTEFWLSDVSAYSSALNLFLAAGWHLAVCWPLPFCRCCLVMQTFSQWPFLPQKLQVALCAGQVVSLW